MSREPPRRPSNCLAAADPVCNRDGGSRNVSNMIKLIFVFKEVTLTLNEEKAANKKLSLLAKSINVKAKAEKPPASVKTAVKKSAKLPVKAPSGGQREVQGIESNMEAKQSQSE
jgi:uncharacterized coiled-coil DUF342 family protein